MELTRKTVSLRTKKGDLSGLMFGKKAPQAPELESAVLGSIMLDPQSLSDVLEIIQNEDCFYADANQRIFRAILALEQNGSRIDFMTVCEQLKKTGELEMVGGSYYVTSLTRDVVSSANIETHARIIIEKYVMRELIRMSGEVIKDAYEDSTDVFDLLDSAESVLYEITDKHLRKNFTPINQVIAETMDELEKQAKRSSDLTGVPSGFTDLDRITAGWQKTDLIILAARPSVGKTAFSLNLALNAALHPEPTGVAFFSLEMSKGQIVKRLLSAVTDVSMNKITRGNLSDTDLQILSSKMGKLMESKIFIDDQAALNMFELRAKARRLKQKHDIGLIIIDYLQLMSGSKDSKNANRQEEISKISRDLKGLAKELEIPIIALSQLNRNVENRTSQNKMPQLSDLRESGAIEQDADLVMFLYRPEYYQKGETPEDIENSGLTEINIAKHRNGITDIVKIKAVLEFQRFEDWKEITGATSMGAAIFNPNAGMNPDRFSADGPNLKIDQSFDVRSSRLNNLDAFDDEPDFDDDEPAF